VAKVEVEVPAFRHNAISKGNTKGNPKVIININPNRNTKGNPKVIIVISYFCFVISCFLFLLRDLMFLVFGA
jgi:hypothetical protein